MSATKNDKITEKKASADPVRSLTGGAYIPPAKLKLMLEQNSDKNSENYQRINWERLKKKIQRQVNIVNTANLVAVVRDLLQENIIRGKGLLARSIIQAQDFSPAYSNVYAAFVAVINSKFPHIGELILKRLVARFRQSFCRNDKKTTVTVAKFIAHLINQQVVHEILALELMVLMLENPTEDSVEVTVAFLKECGAKLTELSVHGINAIFDRLRSILMEANIDKRIQYMIEVIYSIRRDGFKGFPPVIEDLDLIDEEDQITHTITLEDKIDPENMLNVFKFDPDFEKNEALYDEIRREVIGDPDETSDEESDDEKNQSEEEIDKEQKETLTIIDSTEQNLMAFRRNVYLTIQSSLDYQEAAHKLLKIDLKPGQDVELCNMIVDCCAQQRTYEKFYGLLAERFCRLRKEFQDAFERIARDTYNTIHRFDITKLRNMARLVAHLLYSDAISWNVLEEISLNEDDTTSAGRIYIKTLFQEVAEFMGVVNLMKRVRDPTMQIAFDKIFPRDNPNHTRFSINFFTSIGLGYLTVDLRSHLKRKVADKKQYTSDELSSESESDSGSSSDSSDTSSSDTETSSTTDDSSVKTSSPKVKHSPIRKRAKVDEKKATNDARNDDGSEKKHIDENKSRRRHSDDDRLEKNRSSNGEEYNKKHGDDDRSRKRHIVDDIGKSEKKRADAGGNDKCRKKHLDESDGRYRKERSDDDDGKHKKKRKEDGDNRSRRKLVEHEKSRNHHNSNDDDDRPRRKHAEDDKFRKKRRGDDNDYDDDSSRKRHADDDRSRSKHAAIDGSKRKREDSSEGSRNHSSSEKDERHHHKKSRPSRH